MRIKKSDSKIEPSPVKEPDVQDIKAKENKVSSGKIRKKTNLAEQIGSSSGKYLNSKSLAKNFANRNLEMRLQEREIAAKNISSTEMTLKTKATGTARYVDPSRLLIAPDKRTRSPDIDLDPDINIALQNTLNSLRKMDHSSIDQGTLPEYKKTNLEKDKKKIL